MKRLIIILLLVIPVFRIVAETTQTCPEIVQTALETAGTLCELTGRNQVCYANLQLEAEVNADIQFDQVGDIANVVDLSSLRLSPMDVNEGVWGVALMRLQANLPEVLPGQNVTFILFGDVELTNAVTPEQVLAGDYSPMQAFYLRTGIGDAQCAEAPQSGMLVQTPEGMGQINFVINEVEVQLGSTVMFQASNTESLEVTALEGSATLKIDEDVYPVVAGTRYGVQLLQDGRRFVPVPELPVGYDPAVIQGLPMSLLDHEIEVQSPLDKSELNILLDRIETGEPVCGGEVFLPSCDRLSSDAGGSPCVMPDEAGNYPAGAEICDVSYDFGDSNWCVVVPDNGTLPEGETRPICPAPGEHPDCIMPSPPGVEPPPSDGRPFCDEYYSDDGGNDAEHEDDESDDSPEQSDDESDDD